MEDILAPEDASENPRKNAHRAIIAAISMLNYGSEIVNFYSEMPFSKVAGRRQDGGQLQTKFLLLRRYMIYFNKNHSSHRKKQHDPEKKRHFGRMGQRTTCDLPHLSLNDILEMRGAMTLFPTKKGNC
jgi:hypothetical protein